MRKLKLFLSLLMVMLLSVGNVWAGQVTISPSQALNDGGVDPINIACAKGDGTSNPAISSGQLRLYQAASGKTTGNTITFSSESAITSIVFTFANSMTASNGSFSEGSYDSESSTWTGSSTSLTLTVTGTTSGTRIYITNMVVTYSDGGKTLTSIAVSGTPTKTAYYVGDEFDPAGLVVTGTYSDETQATISSGITWAYDPSQELALNQTSIGVTATVSEISSPKFNVTGLTVTEAPAAVNYEKVTAAPEDWSGEYLLVYEDGSDAYVWNGADAVNCYVAATISNDVIAKPEGAATLTIAEDGTGYSLLINGGANDGKYITDNANNAALKFADAAYAATLSYETTWTKILFSQRCIRFNNASNQLRFRYYAANGQQPVQLYKKVGAAPAVAKPTITGANNFLTSTEVTIECTTDGAAIYYTTTESAKATPATSGDWMAYNGASKPSFSSTTTIWAAAKLGDDWSDVAEKTFTQATVMTVAQALAASAGANQYVKGIISSIDEVSTEHGNATYYLKDEGQENSIKIYRGKYLDNASFTQENQIIVGDEVTIFGTISEYQSANQFAQGNYIVAMKPAARLAWAGTTEGVYDASLEGANTFPTLTNTNGVDVEYSSSNGSAATINPSTGAISLVAVGSTTITAAFTGNETYKANSVSYTLNVASSLVTLTYNVDGGEAIDPVNVSALPNPLPTTTKAGKNFGGWFTDTEKTVAAVPGAAISENTTLYAKWLEPYNITDAKAVIDAAPAGTTNQYVAGIISQIDSYNNTYHSITYWISADGTTTNQLQVYGGLIGNAATALGKEDFSAKEDLELGDEVVVTGTLKLHNSSVYEFDKNNTIYTFSRKASAGLEYAEKAVNKVVGDDAFVNELTNPNGVAVTYGTSDDQVAEVANDGTVTINGEGSAIITATFAGNDQYKAASVSYTITVNAAAPVVDPRKVANSPAAFTTTSGNLDPADITFEAFKGGAGTAPANYNNGIRLYQAPSASAIGGYITLTAVAGCTIDEVQITTTGTYATTVTYSIDGNETLLKSESVAKSGSYTTGTGLNVQSVNIVNKGTTSSGRLEIASIKVYYTGDALTIDHYELGGTYATEFEVGDDFNHNGLIVYAAYDALGENKVDITSACTFSTPDMSTEGQKTIDITYKEEVVKNYTITVNASTDTRKVAESPATFTAVSGDMTPADITFASYKGGAGNDPYLATNGIRLYQISGTNDFGGFITLTAKKGCTIDQVKVTTSDSYATTVAYSVDGNENLLGEGSVAKSGDYTTPAGLNVESVNILNLGTGSSGRLEIASIKVWYTGDALAVDHYILGGTYATEFEQYGEFNHEGLIVYAAYDAQGDDKEDITAACTFSEPDMSEAGEKTIEITYKEAVVKSYTITVNASAKEDPAFEYSPASATITAGDEWNAPTLNKAFEVSPISFVSDKPAVATVDENGVITLVGGYGTAVITASFEGDDDYLASEATYTITVNEPGDDLTGTWVLASSVAAGDKFIVVGSYNNKTMAMGKQNSNNRAAVASSVDEWNVLTPGVGTKVFTLVDAGEGKFAIQASNGKYLSAAGTGTNNYLREAADFEADNAKWTISIENGVANVVASSNNRNVMRYNSTNNSELFSCYQSGAQRDIQIYKIGTPDYGSYNRDGLTAGNYGTICLPNAGTIEGAKLFDLDYYDGANTLYLLEVNGNAMVAGRPYIFLPEANEITVTYTDNAGADAGSFNGLVGSYTQQTVAIGTGDDANYILYQNAYYLVNSEAYVGENRAYIHMAGVSTTPTPQVGQAPRRRVGMSVHGEKTTTDIDALNASDTPIKMIIDGQLFIIRGEKMFNANGQLVK